MTTTADIPQAQQPSSAFHLLDPDVQRWIWQKQWPALRPAQEQAIEPVLAGTRDVIISAATAAGKTEAAFLPICTALLQARAAAAHDARRHGPPAAGEADRGAPVGGTGVKVLYVSPLKALINDQWGRLDGLCEHLDIPVHRWHGDVGATRKKALLTRPDGILLITPESLEALFVHRGTTIPVLFAGLRYVVIDEMHAFLGSPRGRQLESLLHRVELAVRRRVPRIALSATLGDMSQAQEYLRPGDPDGVLVITETNASTDIRLQLRGYIEAAATKTPTPGSSAGPGHAQPADSADGGDAHDTDAATTSGSGDNEAGLDEVQADQHVFDISKHLLGTLRGTSNLVFANSRGNVEQYADRLARMCATAHVPNEFFPHHGSLSKDLREDVEARLRDPSRPTTAVCTSTLELGIDIGAVTSVAQLGAPPTVAGLRQRLGRSGRRAGEAATMRLYVSEPELTPQSHPTDTIRAELVQTVAMVDLLLARWYEPLEGSDLHLSTLIQQILSVTAQHGGILPADAYRALCVAGPFAQVPQGMFAQLLRDMGTTELLTQASDGLLLPGQVGERLVNHYSFYAAFRTADEFRLVADGRTLGTLPIGFPVLVGSHLIFGGRRWRVIAVDDRAKVIELTRSKGGKVPSFAGNGAAVSTQVREQMLVRYHSNDMPTYLDATGQRLLDEGCDYFRRWDLDTRPLIAHGNETLLFPWRSDRVHATIAVILAAEGIAADAHGVAVVVEAAPDELLTCVDQILTGPPPSPVELASTVENKIVDKFDEYLGKDLLDEAYAARSLDVPEAIAALAAMRARTPGANGV